MSYVIVTARSLLWILASLIALLMMLSALVSPSWLVTPSKEIEYGNETITYTPSVGVYARCSVPIQFDKPSCTTLAVRGLATDSDVFPTVWKAAVVFITLGLLHVFSLDKIILN